MTAVTVLVPDETLDALSYTPEEMADEMRLSTAVRLYQAGRLSSGAAAALAGVPRVVFLSRLAEYGVDTFRQTDAELDEEAANACQWAQSRR